MVWCPPLSFWKCLIARPDPRALLLDYEVTYLISYLTPNSAIRNPHLNTQTFLWMTTRFLAKSKVKNKRAVAQIDFMLRQAQHERKSHMISTYHRSPWACRRAKDWFGQQPVYSWLSLYFTKVSFWPQASSPPRRFAGWRPRGPYHYRVSSVVKIWNRKASKGTKNPLRLHVGHFWIARFMIFSKRLGVRLVV